MSHGKKSEKAGNMGGRGGKARGPQMTKKSTGFGARVAAPGSKRKSAAGLEGPNTNFKP